MQKEFLMKNQAFKLVALFAFVCLTLSLYSSAIPLASQIPSDSAVLFFGESLDLQKDTQTQSDSTTPAGEQTSQGEDSTKPTQPQAEKETVKDVGGKTIGEVHEETAVPLKKLSEESKKVGGDGISFPQSAVLRTSNSIVGPPSISPEQIRKILDSYKSPAAGSEQCFFDLSYEYNIDVAFMLGFFLKESSMGRAKGYSTHHAIGNIVKSAPGSQFCSSTKRVNSRFCGYDSWCDAAAHWYYYIKNSKLYIPKGKDTPEEILPIYAPASDGNKPYAYAAMVNKCVNSWRAGNARC
ncbi:MAG: hypothetical protein V1717_00185 [Candidatus Micrarchaeota archaeon]